MSAIAINHQLYFYQLFCERLGIGRQTSPSQVADVLTSVDVDPIDVGAEDVHDLLSALPSFIKITIYKHGRVIVTLLRNPEFDLILEKANTATTTKAASKGRPWKTKGSRVPIPIKPKPAQKRIGNAAAAKGTPQNRESKEMELAPDTTVATEESVAGATLNREPMISSEATLTNEMHRTDVDKKAADDRGAPMENSDSLYTDILLAQTDTRTQDTSYASIQKSVRAEDNAERMTDEQRISLTITYDPSTQAHTPTTQDKAMDAPAAESTQRKRERTRRRSQRPLQQDLVALSSPTPELELPKRLSHDLWISDAMLSKLYDAFPDTPDRWSLLDAAWEMASAQKPDARGPITFSIDADTVAPLLATIKRRSPMPSGRRWELLALEITTPEAESEEQQT